MHRCRGTFSPLCRKGLAALILILSSRRQPQREPVLTEVSTESAARPRTVRSIRLRRSIARMTPPRAAAKKHHTEAKALEASGLRGIRIVHRRAPRWSQRQLRLPECSCNLEVTIRIRGELRALACGRVMVK
jgi:hypothetical protein